MRTTRTNSGAGKKKTAKKTARTAKAKPKNGGAPTKEPPTKRIEIQELQLAEIVVPIVGTSPMIMHNWDNRVLEGIKAERATGNKAGRRRMTPEEKHRTYEATIYFIDKKKKRYGFPATGFKKALVRAATYVDIKMTQARGLFHVLPAKGSPLVEIIADSPIYMREDVVRLQGKTMDLRYRACIEEWRANVRVQFNERLISPSTVATLFRNAGFSVGIGDWRPECDGPYGMFTVDADQFAELLGGD